MGLSLCYFVALCFDVAAAIPHDIQERSVMLTVDYFPDLTLMIMGS